MKAVVKNFMCLTPGIDLSTYYPDNPETRIIHESNGEGGVFGKDKLIVFEYDLEVIKRCISQCVENCAGTDFGEIARKIGRVASWEFEDYENQSAPTS